MKKILDNLKKLNHEWCCAKNRCTCDKLDLKDEPDLGDRIIQEMWNKNKRLRNERKWFILLKQRQS